LLVHASIKKAILAAALQFCFAIRINILFQQNKTLEGKNSRFSSDPKAQKDTETRRLTAKNIFLSSTLFKIKASKSSK